MKMLRWIVIAILISAGTMALPYFRTGGGGGGGSGGDAGGVSGLQSKAAELGLKIRGLMGQTTAGDAADTPAGAAGGNSELTKARGSVDSLENTYQKELGTHGESDNDPKDQSDKALRRLQRQPAFEREPDPVRTDDLEGAFKKH